MQTKAELLATWCLDHGAAPAPDGRCLLCDAAPGTLCLGKQHTAAGLARWIAANRQEQRAAAEARVIKAAIEWRKPYGGLNDDLSRRETLASAIDALLAMGGVDGD